MSENLPVEIIIAYALYAFFAAEQKFAVQEARGRSQKLFSVLLMFAAATSIFGIGYLIYYALVVKWWGAIALFLIGMLSFTILGFIGVLVSPRIIALISFVTIPLLARYLIRLAPIPN